MNGRAPSNRNGKHFNPTLVTTKHRDHAEMIIYWFSRQI